MFDEIEKRTEDRERAWEEKRLKLELKMEEKRQKREQDQDDKMLSTFLQQMSSLLHPPRQDFQAPLYPGHSSMTAHRHGTYNLFPPNPPYFSSQNTTAA